MTNIRPLTVADLPLLAALDTNYIADTLLVVEHTQQGLEATFRIVERPRAVAYVKREGYELGPRYQRELAGRIACGTGLYLVAEEQGSLVGLLDVEPADWRPAAELHWIAVDRPWRGRGIGRQLLERAVEWTRGQGLRALVLETQNTNVDACRFYLHSGFRLSGVQDPYYFDQRVAEECALFWVYEL